LPANGSAIPLRYPLPLALPNVRRLRAWTTRTWRARPPSVLRAHCLAAARRSPTAAAVTVLAGSPPPPPPPPPRTWRAFCGADVALSVALDTCLLFLAFRGRQCVRRRQAAFPTLHHLPLDLRLLFCCTFTTFRFHHCAPDTVAYCQADTSLGVQTCKTPCVPSFLRRFVSALSCGDWWHVVWTRDGLHVPRCGGLPPHSSSPSCLACCGVLDGFLLPVLPVLARAFLPTLYLPVLPCIMLPITLHVPAAETWFLHSARAGRVLGSARGIRYWNSQRERMKQVLMPPSQVGCLGLGLLLLHFYATTLPAAACSVLPSACLLYLLPCLPFDLLFCLGRLTCVLCLF